MIFEQNSVHLNLLEPYCLLPSAYCLPTQIISRIKSYSYIEYLSKGDVIVINYPFFDASDSKKRPALIVAESGSNIIVCVITSKSGREKEIKLEDEDFRVGKLDLVSYIHPNAIYTTKKDLVLRKVGSLKDEKMN